MAAGASDIPVNSAPIRWTLPTAWKEKPADGIRLGSFAISGENGGKAEVAITSFPGSVGTELDNVNRWRGELSLVPGGTSDVASEPVTVDSCQGKLYDITGAAARTVVAMIPRNGSSWFIKLRGETATVAAAKPVFLEFLKSIRFGGDGGAPVAADPHAGLQELSNPHEGLAASDASSGEPKWKVPVQWVESKPSSTMIFRSFAVAGDEGAKADITVSFFQGTVGGVLANVNRWRGQMGQPPVEQSKLESVTESLATPDGKATLVDFMGTDAKTGQPARMVAAIVPHGDQTWFYKMMGDGKVVEAQKNSFVEFVKTVQYP
jgi:outer membrane protein assembly factor BamB